MAQAGMRKLSSRAKKQLQEQQANPLAFAAAGLSGDEDVADDAWLAMTYETRKLLLHDLANMRDEAAIPWFWRRRTGMFVEPIVDVMGMRDELRGIWTGRQHYAQNVLNKWLRWLPSKDHVEIHRRPIAEIPSAFMPFGCSLDARRLIPNYSSLRSMLIQGVFEHWGYFKTCSNPDCASPYFIAKRKDQTVCDSGVCKAEKQRQHALKWWTENRAKKVSTKGRLKDGTRKTR
jgi:hypothetical protein